MLRTKLEPKLDRLLGERLQERSFLAAVLDAYRNQLEQSPARQGADQSAIVAKLGDLKVKRHRVLEAFFEGIIEKQERDRKLASIRDESESYQKLLLESAQPDAPSCVEDLKQVLEPFAEWEFLEREDKRTLLCPEIRIFQYHVKSVVLRFGAPTSDSHDVNRSRTAA